MKLCWKDNDISGYAVSVRWSGSASQAARSVEFDLAYSPNDSAVKVLNVKEGDKVTFYPGWPDDKKTKFVGSITGREKKSEAGTLTYTARDGMIHLLRSSGTYKFKKKTPEKIAAMVCKDIGIPVGTLAKTKVGIPKIFFQERPYYEIIMAAYTKAKKKTKKPYMAQMKAAKLEVIEKGKLISDFWIKDDERILESSYSVTSDNMVNRVYIYNSKNKKIGSVSKPKWIQKFGVFQGTVSVDSGKGKTEAKNQLHGLDKSASLTALGDPRCVSGLAVRIQDTRSGLAGKYWIENDTHEWSGGTYTMTLELEFKNVMDTQAGDSQQKASSKSSESVTDSSAIQDILNQARAWIGISGNTNAATQYYGMNGVAWCCIFQWSCFNKSGHGKCFMNGGKTGRVYTVRDWYKARGKTGKTPKVGALVIFNWSHIGIVEKVKSKTKIITIEGNTTGCKCRRKERSMSQISCFCYPDYPKVKTSSTKKIEIYKGGKLKWPLPGYKTITGKFGANRGDHIHAGIDIGTHGATGKPCVAAADGKVVKYVPLAQGGASGHYIDIDHGGGIVTRYMHLQPGTGLRKGALVKRGERVGTVGGSGFGKTRYYAIHLHFEVHKNYKNGQGKVVNPATYF